MTKKFEHVLSDDWLPLEFQSGNSVPVTSVLVNRKTLKSIVEQTEQAVLQSPEIQALRKDAERYQWLRRGSIKDVAVVRGLDAMDYGPSGVASTYSEEIEGDDLDTAIDATMEKMNDA